MFCSGSSQIVSLKQQIEAALIAYGFLENNLILEYFQRANMFITREWLYIEITYGCAINNSRSFVNGQHLQIYKWSDDKVYLKHTYVDALGKIV